jgi:branched-chain amino acid transport system ATP-binding protein
VLETTTHPPAGTSDTALLSVDGIAADYGKRRVLHDVSLRVAPGEIVSVLGHNGAGKTTMLKAIFGVVPLRAGRVSFDGQPMAGWTTTTCVRSGISFTPAEAPIFRELTIGENLELGAFTVDDAAVQEQRLARVHHMFPLLKERAGDQAGTLSGGQQRTLSIGLALMSGARLMLLDEPSLGIAPSLVQDLFARIRELSDSEGLGVVLVEQNVRAALPIADRVYYMRAGRMILEESAEESSRRSDWWELF